MKIAIITHKTKNLARTRKKLLKCFLSKQYEVVGICPEQEYTEELEKMGVSTIVVKNDRISINLFKIIPYFLTLIKVLKQEKPDIVLNYTIKPNIIGSLAAKIAKVPKIYSMVTGLGYIYSTKKLRFLLIRKFCTIGYKLAFKYNTKVIFQNKEDRQEFIEKKYINASKAFIVDGSGVDMEIFKKCNLPKNFNFLMIARAIEVKGVKEFCKAAEIVKNKYPFVTFTFVGEIEKSYRGINPNFIQEYEKKGIIKFEGHKENVVPYLQNCKIFVLPSYLKEGIPRTLLEALSVGRPIITTDVRGCRETVKENKNGFLVQPRDFYDLARKMEYMIKNENKLESMGNCSYEYAKERFEINKINHQMMEIIK